MMIYLKKKTLTEHILVMLMKFLTKIKITTTIMYSQKSFHINELENNGSKFFGIKIMLNFGQQKQQEKNFMVQKFNQIWVVDVDNIAISKFAETKNNWKYLFRYLVDVKRVLILISPKIN